jgi:hypothetical protein
MQGPYSSLINGAGLDEWSVSGVRSSYTASRSPSRIDQSSNREIGAAIVVEDGLSVG